MCIPELLLLPANVTICHRETSPGKQKAAALLLVVSEVLYPIRTSEAIVNLCLPTSQMVQKVFMS